MQTWFSYSGRRLFAAALLVIFSGSTRFSFASRSCACVDRSSVADLPVIELRAEHDRGWLAILVTGDGGWRAIDRGVAAGLNLRGISVVGLVSPDYFAIRRTPDESSCALQRLITHYSLSWHAPHVMVCGYSRGAGVVPFMFNRLPDHWRSRVELLALIGLDRTIGFEVTPVSLLSDSPDEVPVRGEVEKARGPRIVCIYGKRDHDSLCPELDPMIVTRIAEPGGHHFTGDYDELAGAIWRASRGKRAAA